MARKRSSSSLRFRRKFGRVSQQLGSGMKTWREKEAKEEKERGRESDATRLTSNPL